MMAFSAIDASLAESDGKVDNGNHPHRHQLRKRSVSILPRSYYKFRKQMIFPLAPMGVLALGSAHARPSARPPINTSRNFPAHMSAESPSNITPNPSEVISEVSEPYDNF